MRQQESQPGVILDYVPPPSSSLTTIRAVFFDLVRGLAPTTSFQAATCKSYSHPVFARTGHAADQELSHECHHQPLFRYFTRSGF